MHNIKHTSCTLHLRVVTDSSFCLQFPFSTKDKVLSYTIPIDHDERVLFRGNSNDGTSATRGSTHNVRGGGTLNCTTPGELNNTTTYFL